LDLHPGFARSVQGGQHGSQIAATGNRAKGPGIEGIEGNVEATDAAFGQQRQLALEQLAVGGQADVVETELADLAQEGLQARTDQRFTAGDTQALDTGSLDQI